MTIIVFRADASLQIGTGHVMRCLALADALKAEGVECHFICREHPGNLIDYIRSKDYHVHALAYGPQLKASPLPINRLTAESQLTHAAWLGSTQAQDSAECAEYMVALQPDWLIVDHYALDVQWESVLQPYYRKLMVIDDLADRVHVCQLLLDQNLGREAQHYAGLVPDDCQVFVAPQFALLRPEFAELRKYSLKRRTCPRLKHLLITMGGVDQPNATGQVLEALKRCPLPAGCRITVVMGAAAPWLAKIQAQAALMPWSTEVLVNIQDMAQRMADCDFAFGAAGSTSWERCCLGVPTMMVILAENQLAIGEALDRSGAAILIGRSTDKDFHAQCVTRFSQCLDEAERLNRMSQAAAGVTDGTGSQLIAQWLFEK